MKSAMPNKASPRLGLLCLGHKLPDDGGVGCS